MSNRYDDFLALHARGNPLLLPNPWDVGSARLFASLGFGALATTSSGAAAARGLADGELGADGAIAHVGEIAAATDLPVSADLENGFADDPAAVAALVTRAAGAGAAGCSIEDWDPVRERIYDSDLAVERIAAAVVAARSSRIVLTARAENHIRGRDELADTMRRLTAFAAAGADVVYAPGITAREDIAAVVAAVERPLNVLARPGLPPLAELAELGVRRVSVGGAFAFAAYAAAAAAATEFRDAGTYGFTAAAADGVAAIQRAFDAS